MKKEVFFWSLVALAAVVALLGLLFVWRDTIKNIEYTYTNNFTVWASPQKTFVAPPVVKGLYLTAYSAGNSKKIDEIIKLIQRTELNSVVIDIKDYSGYILYDSNLPFVVKNKMRSVRVTDLRALIDKLHQANIYTIARVSTFQDPLLAETKPEWALRDKFGGLWRDHKGLAWIDPNKKEIWNYIISVAKEVVRFGFDEVNFDYIRFPTDGNLKQIVYTHGDRAKYEVIADFFQYVLASMSSTGAVLSADLFGLTTQRTGTDDMNIGQRWGDAVRNFDYVCPMVYPSHYPPKYMGFANPAEHPYEVIYSAVSSGVRRAQATRAQVRPWLQAFNMGAIYDAAKIRAQIDASDKAGAQGWLLWNAANRYTDAGLNLE